MQEGASVCIFAGHTGGHLFPAFAFAERFKKRFPASCLTLITSPKAKPMLASLPDGGFDGVEYLNEFPLPAGISLRTFRFLLEFSRAFLLTSQKLEKLRPHLCVGFGSYVSYPGMKLACIKKIPALIHEQNKIAGKATQKLASGADITAMSFPETFCKGKIRRCEIVGLPVRFRLFNAAREFKRRFLAASPGNPLQVFITGGSQGAHGLNKVILESFFRLLPEERQKIAVTHITGTADFDWVTQEYKKMEMNPKIYPFYEKMQELYSQADFAITRAGANTLFEMALFGLPALAVPYPYAAENHQEVNARYFESREALLVKKESELTPEVLGEVVRGMMLPEFRQHLSSRMTQIAPQDAAENLVDLACELLSKELS